ncbi:DUF2550 domain-containing protein [Cellulomonas sp. zg-ZUI222]|uniref:DUF2550 domain-containing protein n=1 Tax=Cellulomonas wangleii TaxID=2816956 RepID=A0ABX8D857_9CELL|nr:MULTISPECIES: DUF2550 family protein [Cellulomonas]MBO0901503.1 DUF2550 domain-containing protein [Cellulomonas sp. zg-ZUI22]MBO0922378.1 DUF2550 domain-containing protein [Cellulomonas wangleii]MBO0926073.1 DUF2550 domain-containing protein [Cellulomonas wangleii]QVI63361.1 DUF2550 domain-containing protein [Cellulomonas wangleii]
MNGAAWITVAATLVLLAGVVAVVWLSRTSTLSRRVGSFSCRLVEAAHDGRTPSARGVAQYGSVTLYWWRRASVMPRPARTWSRGSIVVLERTVLPLVPGKPQAVVARCQVAPATGGPLQEIRLQMSADAYAGFTSWLEATPSRVGKVF